MYLLFLIVTHLQQFNSLVTEPFLDGCTRITLIILSNSILQYLVQQLRKLNFTGQLLFPPIAFFFGLLNIYLFSTWEVLEFVFTLSLVHGYIFRELLLNWRQFSYSVESFTCLNYGLKFCAILSALISLHLFHKGKDIEEFIIALITVTVKMVSATEDILQPKNHDKLMDNDNVGFLTSLEIVGYIAFPSWISFEDFQSLSRQQRARDVNWQSMMYSASSRAILLHMVSCKSLDNYYIGNFLGHSTVLYLIQSFQHRCKYYYRAQLAELEAITLGVERGVFQTHRNFDFTRAESSILITDFLIGFNIPLTSYAKDGLSHGRTLEMVLLFGLAPVITIATYDLLFAIMWAYFVISICILIQISAMERLINGTRTMLCRLHFKKVDSTLRRRGGAPPIYMSQGLKLFLIFCNHLRLAAIFNLKAAHMGVPLFFTICGMVMDVTILLMFWC